MTLVQDYGTDLFVRRFKLQHGIEVSFGVSYENVVRNVQVIEIFRVSINNWLAGVRSGCVAELWSR